MALDQMYGLGNVDFSGGLGGMLGGLQNQRVEQSNELSMLDTISQIKQRLAMANYYGAEQGDRFADKKAKADEQSHNEALANDYAALSGVKGQISKGKDGKPNYDRAGLQFSNIWDSLSPATKKMFADGNTTPDGQMGFDFNPDTLDSNIEAIAAQHPTLSKVLNTNAKTESAEKIADKNNETRLKVADIMSGARKVSPGIQGIVQQATSGKLGFEKAAAALKLIAATSESPEEQQHALDLAVQFETANLRARSAAGIDKPAVGPLGITPNVPQPALGGNGPKPGSKENPIKLD